MNQPEGRQRRREDLLGCCLIKDPKQRLEAIGEARIAIEGTLSESAVAPAPQSPPQQGGRGAEWQAVARGLALGVAPAPCTVASGLQTKEGAQQLMLQIEDGSLAGRHSGA